MLSDKQDDNPPVYTYGTDPAIATLIYQYEQTPSPYDNVFINVTTLIRNSTNKDTNVKQGYESVSDQILRITKELCASMAHSKFTRNPTLVFYTGKYDTMVPETVLRTRTDFHILCSKINDLLIRDMSKLSSTNYNSVKVKYEVLPYKKASFNSLNSILRDCDNKGSVYLMTHQPIDLHIYRQHPAFKLISSYTGAILSAKDFGKKVFSHPEVAFCIPTHTILGDKELIKSQLSISEKRNLYELAQFERWAIHTSEYIADSLKKHGYALPFNLN